VPADLPAVPGVYQFEADGGTALYVGKSVNLRRRVRGWFYAGGPADPRLAEMLALARAVTVEPAGSDLEARLVEAGRIVAGRPRYNRALKNRARGWYLELDLGEPFPRPRVVRAPRRARARYWGPYAGRAPAARLAGLVERAFRLRSCAGAVRPDREGSACLAHGLDLCTAPCVAAVGLDAYRAQADSAADALAHPARALEAARTLEAERDRASGALEFERAARCQRRIEWLDEIESLRPALDARWLERAWLVVLPHAREGWGTLLGVARGRVLPRRAVEWDDPAWEGAVEDACYAVRVAALAAGPVLEPDELVASRIVTGWMLDGAPDGLPVDLDAHTDGDAAAVIGAWRDAVRS
jgi:excinuclease UvrABC nuclease subunit